MSIFNYKEYLYFVTIANVNNDKADIEDFYNQLYITKKFRNWFAMKPIIDVSFETNTFEVGSKGTFKFRCLPFCYSMVCTKMVPNEYIESEFIGKVEGGVKVWLTSNGKTTQMYHELRIRGKSRLVHWYYLLACAGPHKPYMDKKFRLLERNTYQDTLEKKQRLKDN